MLHALARKLRLDVQPVVFFTSAGLLIAFIVFGVVFTDTASYVLEDVLLAGITDNFGWLMIGAVAAFIVFCLYLVVGPHAKVRLGPPDSRPDYGYLSWFAMLFSAGMGIGLVFYGVAEPLVHYAEAPRTESETAQSAQDAMVLVFHHWGLGPWAVYAVLGLALAYFGFRHGLPLTVRSALYPVIGERIHGPVGHTVDILAVLGTLFGVATSLGLGVLQVNAALSYVFGVSQSTVIQVVLVVVITLMATISVMTGLDKGIRILSQTNLVLAALLLLFIAVVGPTVLLMSAYLENIGAYIGQAVPTMFWTGTYTYDPEVDAWLSSWTLFYWAWWISWSPFVGMFIARISRGRTIREFVAGVLLVPALLSFLWFTVLGNTALHIELRDTADLLTPTFADSSYSFAMFALLEQFPFSTLTSIVAGLLIVVFFVTSSDSGSYVIGIISTGGDPQPHTSNRVFWALLEGAIAAVLLLAGGLTALQAGALTTGLPFTVVLLLVMVGLWKALRGESRGRGMRRIAREPLVGSGGERNEDESTEEESGGNRRGVDTGTASDEGSR
ncbi:choline/glycine/proline betaine transport protein [Spinactinospora alkalitolerans]|uniref:Choline/glycine/proline betaine transport protein n=1 Tax=Spinactinospora alkalitolerans TaxID=687207 RepID=A0A852TWW1_9ACTN|nr:BCCT family transporter [Spinactinospora alkalitolerans]NYE48428.1 choline/glycine/proline betaine transport protein [Spinactinospora alkalitolerans]